LYFRNYFTNIYDIYQLGPPDLISDANISNEIPTVSEEIPTVSEEIPTVFEEIPTVSEEIPIVSEEISMESQEIPTVSKSESKFEAKRKEAMERRLKRAREKKEYLNSANIQQENGATKVTQQSDFLPITGLEFR
jgi:uncharacterized coiled-coil DUF342 family protein